MPCISALDPFFKPGNRSGMDLPDSSEQRFQVLIKRLIVAPVLLSLVNPDGSVSGDHFGESDTRFSYILLQALALLGRLKALDDLFEGRGRDLVVDNIRRSMNFDGAFGSGPGGESHGAQGQLGRFIRWRNSS